MQTYHIVISEQQRELLENAVRVAAYTARGESREELELLTSMLSKLPVEEQRDPATITVFVFKSTK